MAYDIGAKIGIDGEKEFRDAIKNINTNMKTLGTEMLAVTSQFDKNEKSAASLTAKNQVLNKQIEEQKNKLAELTKGLEASSEKYGKNDKVTQSWQQAVNKATADLNNMERELRGNEAALDETAKGLEKASKAADDSGSRFEKLGDTLKKSAVAIGAVAVAAGAAALKLGSEVVKQFGELEQNLGGSEAVFGEYAKSIQKTGEEAYKNMGVSQSQYLATANKMGALFQGSGLEQQKSLELTEKAMQRAADMASVMGIDMQQALDSVAGAAKGNFTMMDNLGVAMNATNIEAYALAKGLDFTWNTATQAEKAEVAMQMFFESTEQYAGNFAKEATTTVTGSIGLLQAALGSFTAGLGNTDADMKNLTENLVDAFQAVVKNIVPIIGNLTEALPMAFGAILPAIGEILPELLSVATNLFQQILDTILKLLPELIPVGVEAIMTIVDTVIDNLPLIIDAAFILIMALSDGIIEALPELTPRIVEVIIKIVETIVENLPLIIDAALEIILALAGSMIENLPVIIEAVIEIIGSILATLIKGIGKIIAFVPQLFSTLVTEFRKINWWELGSNIISGIVDGVKKAASSLINSVIDVARSALDGVKDFLGINSPSTVMRDQVGKMMGAGVAIGITDSAREVNAAMEDLTTFNLDNDLDLNSNRSLAGATNNSNIVINMYNTVRSDDDIRKINRGLRQELNNHSRAIGVTT